LLTLSRHHQFLFCAKIKIKNFDRYSRLAKWLWCKRRERGSFQSRRRGQGIQMLSIADLFKGRHFDREISLRPLVLRFKLSFLDLVEMMAERGVRLAHTTIMRWIGRYVPEFEKRWNRFARQAGGSWRVDETYVKIKGSWKYLYRAVDKAGATVDFLLRAKRDVAAAKAFFRRAFEAQGRLPQKNHARRLSGLASGGIQTRA
jgi:DDE domain